MADELQGITVAILAANDALILPEVFAAVLAPVAGS